MSTEPRNPVDTHEDNASRNGYTTPSPDDPPMRDYGDGPADSGSGDIEDVDLTYQKGALSAAVQADIVAKTLRGRFLWSKALGWLRWDKQRWAPCTDERVIEQIRRHQKRAVKDAITRGTSDDDLKKIIGLLSDGHIHSVERLLRGIDGITVDDANELDADPNLLNVANGTLDLRTRQLRPHDPADRITKVARGAWRPDTDPAAWDAFLTRVVPDDDERAYLRRVFGIAAYGRVREHLFPILRGEGGTGKGTTYGAVVFALGSYGIVIDPELLMTKTYGGGANPELLDLRGTRLAIASETNEGRRLDDAVMKRLTGGDSLRARDLYKGTIQWQPAHQLVYVTNHLPQVKGNDPAVWRRVRVIPFDVKLKEGEMDLDLPAKLELHADAVLSWIVDGYFDNLDNGGMRAPKSVTVATADYQAEMDSASQFIADRCDIGRHLQQLSGALYDAYKAWAATEANEVMNQKTFGKELDRLGYRALPRTKLGIPRQGLKLRSIEDLSDEWEARQ